MKRSQWLSLTILGAVILAAYFGLPALSYNQPTPSLLKLYSQARQQDDIPTLLALQASHRNTDEVIKQFQQLNTSFGPVGAVRIYQANICPNTVPAAKDHQRFVLAFELAPRDKNSVNNKRYLFEYVDVYQGRINAQGVHLSHCHPSDNYALSGWQQDAIAYQP